MERFQTYNNRIDWMEDEHIKRINRYSHHLRLRNEIVNKLKYDNQFKSIQEIQQLMELNTFLYGRL